MTDTLLSETPTCNISRRINPITLSLYLYVHTKEHINNNLTSVDKLMFWSKLRLWSKCG